MIKRLKIKFVCINMLIVTVMLAVIFGMVLHITNRNMEEQGNRIIQSIHENPIHRGPAWEEQRVPYFMVTVTSQGIFTVSSDAFFDRTSESELLNIARTVYEGKEEQGILKEHNLRFSRKTVPMGEQIVFVDISTERNMMRGLINTCIFISLLSFILFLAISVLLAQWAVRPVESAWKQQRQFVADASHELKTPLTVIMTNAELLQDPGYEETSKTQFTESILTMSHQMRGLVEGLLNLARVDNGVVKTVFSDVNFSELVSDSILPFEPLFFEKGMELQSEIEEGASVRGSASHLRQVVEILLDNAAKYGESTGPVRIRLHRQGKYVQLCVSTAGAEISREDLKNIFKRFYRIDKARSMNHSYGLGLSIAESIIREHNGKIWAESRGGLNLFHVQLPVLLHCHEA